MLVATGACAPRAATSPVAPGAEFASRADIDRWLADLAAEDAERSAIAAERLQAQGARVVPELMRRFESENYDVRVRASQVVAAIGGTAVPRLRRELRPKTRTQQRWLRRNTVLDTIGQMGPAAAPLSADLLVLLRQTHEEQVTYRVANAWVGIGSAAVAEVTAALADDDPFVANIGFAAAWRLGPAAVDTLLHSTAHGRSEYHRELSANALLAMLGKSSREEGGLSLSDRQGRYKEYVSIDGQAVGERIVATLCPVVGDDGTRPKAVRSVLGAFGSPDLLCSSPDGRVAIANSVRRDRLPEDPTLLFERLAGDPDPKIRGRAAAALATWAQRASTDGAKERVARALIAALADVPPVRHDAASAVVVVAEHLSLADTQTLLAYYLQRGAATEFPHLPQWFVAQLGERAFNALIAAADDDIQPSKERALAVHWLTRVALAKVLGAPAAALTEQQLQMRDAGLQRLEADRDAALQRADASPLADVRAEGFRGIGMMARMRGTFAAQAPLIRKRMGDPAPEVRLVAIYLLSTLLPHSTSVAHQGSIPETTVWQRDPPRPFDRARCKKHRATPTATAATLEMTPWAICRLVELGGDADPEVAGRAQAELRAAVALE